VELIVISQIITTHITTDIITVHITIGDIDHTIMVTVHTTIGDTVTTILTITTDIGMGIMTAITMEIIITGIIPHQTIITFIMVTEKMVQQAELVTELLRLLLLPLDRLLPQPNLLHTLDHQIIHLAKPINHLHIKSRILIQDQLQHIKSRIPIQDRLQHIKSRIHTQGRLQHIKSRILILSLAVQVGLIIVDQAARLAGQIVLIVDQALRAINHTLEVHLAHLLQEEDKKKGRLSCLPFIFLKNFSV